MDDLIEQNQALADRIADLEHRHISDQNFIAGLRQEVYRLAAQRDALCGVLRRIHTCAYDLHNTVIDGCISSDYRIMAATTNVEHIANLALNEMQEIMRNKELEALLTDAGIDINSIPPGSLS